MICITSLIVTGAACIGVPANSKMLTIPALGPAMSRKTLKRIQRLTLLAAKPAAFVVDFEITETQAAAPFISPPTNSYRHISAIPINGFLILKKGYQCDR